MAIQENCWETAAALSPPGLFLWLPHFPCDESLHSRWPSSVQPTPPLGLVLLPTGSLFCWLLWPHSAVLQLKGGDIAVGLVGHLEPGKPRLRARVHSCFLGVWGWGFPETPMRPGCQPAGRAPGASCLASGSRGKTCQQQPQLLACACTQPPLPWARSGFAGA